MSEVILLSAMVSVVVASLWCLPINVKIRVRTG